MQSDRESGAQPRGAGRYAALDGLRGIAALAIMFLHASEFTLGVTYRNAPLAVDFFFLLSGFVLAHAYPAPGRTYIAARLVRLYPLYIAGVALGLALGVGVRLKASQGAIAAALALNAGMIPAFNLGNYIVPFDDPLWSIFYEALLSFGWLVLARALAGWRLWALLAALALAFAFDPAETMLRAAVPFVAGVAVHRLGRGARLAEPWAVAIAAGLGLVLFWPSGFIFPRLAADVVFTVLVGAGAAVRLTELEPAALYLGRLSYPLYTLHWPLAWWAERHGLTGPLGLVAVLAASWALAHLALTLYDEPLRAWLGRLLPSRRQLAPA